MEKFNKKGLLFSLIFPKQKGIHEQFRDWIQILLDSFYWKYLSVKFNFMMNNVP